MRVDRLKGDYIVNFRDLMKRALISRAMMLAASAIAPEIASGTLIERAHSLMGLIVFILIAGLIGYFRGARGIPWRIVSWGVGLMFVFGAIALFFPGLLPRVQAAIQKLLDFSNEGASFIFGPALVKGSTTDSSGGVVSLGFTFGFSVLPTIIFVSMLTAILYHLKILTLIVHGLAWVMQKTMKCSGAETLSTAANIFVGQTEAPLLIRPFLALATRSELMAIMVGGFANIASGVLVFYSGLLTDFVTDAGGHLAAACFISAPATLLVAKLIMPETATPRTSGGVQFKVEKVDANLIDAATRGTSEGLTLALNVGAMLIAFIALVAMLNFITTGILGQWFTLQNMLGTLCAPVMWLVGIPWHEATRAGSLLGLKTVLNEGVAYIQMNVELSKSAEYLSPRSRLLTLYALCGFANIASIGIQIGGISALCPERRGDLSRVALLAMVGGTIATLMGACVVGVLK
jgi:concentrative nucleoside transporter, CNT family